MTAAPHTTVITARAYKGDADFFPVHRLLIDTYALNQPARWSHNWEIRRWEGSRFHHADPAHATIGGRPFSEAVHLWETADGTLVGVAHPDGPDDLTLQIHPAYRFLEPEMLAWAEENLAARTEDGQHKLTTWVYAWDTQRQDMLRAAEYTQGEWWGTMRRRDMAQPIPATSLDSQYTIRHLTRAQADRQRIADILNAAFGRTFHTAEEYRRFEASPSYRDDLHLVAVTPDGTFASFSGLTWDAANRIGIFEPICTHPDHQRHGLARALMTEGLQRLHDLGATHALVGTGDMIPANTLYENMGFTESHINRYWYKTW